MSHSFPDLPRAISTTYDVSRPSVGAVIRGVAGLIVMSMVAGILVVLPFVPGLVFAGQAGSVALDLFEELPEHLTIEQSMLPTTVYARDAESGEERVLTRFYEQNRMPVTYEQISPRMIDAILSSEDPRYFTHGGIDLIGTTRAVLGNVKGGQTQGGSSITQQYVKNVLVQRCELEATSPEKTEDASETLQECWSKVTSAEGSDGYIRKLQEMRYAIALEKRYSKVEILERYLNIANFGGTVYGIEAAARYYFNTSASAVSVGQAAVLAGVVQNPNSYRIDRPEGSIATASGERVNAAPDGSVDDVSPGTLAALDTLRVDGAITAEQYVHAADGYSETKGRQLYVLSRMHEDGKIADEQYTEAVLGPVSPVVTPPTSGCASTGDAAYFCQYVIASIRSDPRFGDTAVARETRLRQGGLQIHTTLDSSLQRSATEAMKRHVPASAEGLDLGGAAVSVEVGTGRVLAVSQNTNFTEDASHADDPSYSALVYAGDQRRGGAAGFNAGSTFKLFALLAWLEAGHSINERVDGRVRAIPRVKNSCDGDWVNHGNAVIRNWGNQPGYVGTPAEFTSRSLNSGYLAMAEQLDLCDISKVASRLGVQDPAGGDLAMNTLFSVLGSANVSPLAMANAYATVASGGMYCPTTAIERVVDPSGEEIVAPPGACTRVLDAGVAATAASALQDVMNGGTGSRANPRDGTPILGKTGSHEVQQTWMIESSTKVATGAWVGNASGLGDMTRRFGERRYALARDVQRAANSLFGGDRFADADTRLTQRSDAEVPDVVGMPVEEAAARLEALGFTVRFDGGTPGSKGADHTVSSQEPSGGLMERGGVVILRAGEEAST